MPWNVVRRNTVDSTNEVAKELISGGAEPWTAIVAKKQVGGKGRYGRRWVSPRGGLYVSALVQEELSKIPLLSLAAGIAVVDALRSLGLSPTMKWPNDVLVDDAKVAGVLVEGLVRAETYWAIIGIGINTDIPLEELPPQLRGRATTLRHLLGMRVNNESLLAALLEALESLYPMPGTEGQVVSRYRDLCSTLGREVVVETSSGRVRGRAVEISPEGFLILETGEGERREIAEGSIVES
jgi:BirA family biotin operon repressor/biotin-[acetyl-CoA-carboxylase] ligase